ncbi:MAG TPA: hypothetical protein PLT27_07600, partial [Nitrospira sp.]|nr:hypothetical protein [Nitrospira sp.]
MEKRTVLFPRFVGVFVECVVERKEHFRRFVDRVVDPVHTRAKQEKGSQADHKPGRERQAPQGGED